MYSSTSKYLHSALYLSVAKLGRDVGRLERLERLGGMLGRGQQVIEGHLDLTVLSDNERLAPGQRAEECGLDLVRLAHGVFLVREQSKGEAVLHLELLVRLLAAVGDAHHHRAERLKLCHGVAEGVRLLGAARRAVVGVEEEHHLLAEDWRLQRLEAHRGAVLVLEREVGRRVAHLQRAARGGAAARDADAAREATCCIDAVCMFCLAYALAAV